MIRIGKLRKKPVGAAGTNSRPADLTAHAALCAGLCFAPAAARWILKWVRPPVNNAFGTSLQLRTLVLGIARAVLIIPRPVAARRRRSWPKLIPFFA